MTREPTSMNRRQFVCAGAGIALAGNAGRAWTAEERSPMKQKLTYGIADIHLFTTKLDELYRFYEQDLGLPVRKEGGELTVTAGGTRLVFESTDGKSGEAFYHVAFNIPENKLESARRWQKQRTPLVRRGDNEIIQFAHWNAHSVFFNDPAGNILEYIARHDLDNSSEGEFSTSDILYASEIGLVVDDVAKTVAAVKEQLGIGVYRDNGANFASIGDEHALLILVKRNRKWTPDRVRPAKVFPVAAAIRGLQPRRFTMDDYRYEISTVPVLTIDQ